jgi:predicted transposase YdaD
VSTKPFDATLKELIELDVTSWAALVDRRPGVTVSVVDADVSTITAAADKVIRVSHPDGDCLIDVEAVSGHAGDAPEALHFYGAALERRHGLPVRSVLLLLRRETIARSATGLLERHLPGATAPYRTFRYDVLRLWELPVASFLAGGLGTLPLAGLTDEAAADLDSVVRQVTKRIQAESEGERAGQLHAATFVLLGLRYEQAVIDRLFQGVTGMEESSTYQLIKSRGAIAEARTILLRQGKVKFGQPASESTARAIEAIADLSRLEALAERLLTASSWEELLAQP